MFYIIILGLIIGILYFYKFEVFENESLPKKCWTVLHYLNKSNSPLYIVHLKSILTGIIIILCTLYNYKNIVIFLGSGIIGLHIAQMTHEYKLINNTHSYV
jgi:hypothetical protein